MDRTQLRCLLNSGPSRVFDVRKLHHEQQLEPIFKIGKLNGVILLKQSVCDEVADRDSLPPIPTKVYLPFDRRRPEDGGESFIFTPSSMRSAMINLLGERTLNHEELTADTTLLTVLGQIPTFSPYLVRDVLERANLRIPEGYFAMPDREAAMIKQRMRARLRPLVATACGGGSKAISETSIERLVQMLWELKDMDGLAPLVAAFKIAPQQAPEIFYAWLGIAFFENEYLKLQPRLKRLASWMSSRANLREALPRDLLDHYQHTVGRARKLLQSHWKRALAILQDYTSTYEELVGATSNVARFLEFLRHSKAHFWTLGECLGCLEQSVEIWEQFCTPVNFAALPYERANELFNILNLINASAGEKGVELAPADSRVAL
jgi:hypothetical protein